MRPDLRSIPIVINALFGISRDRSSLEEDGHCFIGFSRGSAAEEEEASFRSMAHSPKAPPVTLAFEPSQPPAQNRPRFCSAPSPTVQVPWPPSLPHAPPDEEHSGSLWARADQFGHYLREKSIALIQTYAPEKWRDWMLENLERISTTVQDACDQENRSRLDELWSTTLNGDPNKNTAGSSWSSSSALIAPIVACSIFLVVFTVLSPILTSVLLGLALPFYAVYAGVSKFRQWRTESEGDHHRQNLNSKHLSYWFIGAASTDLIISIIIAGTTSSGSKDDDHQPRWLLTTVLYYALPVLAFSGAKLYSDNFRRSTTEEANNENSPKPTTRLNENNWLLEYFLLTYALRCFALRAFLLFPECLRTYLAYAASYLAINKDRSASSLLSSSCSARSSEQSTPVEAGGGEHPLAAIGYSPLGGARFAQQAAAGSGAPGAAATTTTVTSSSSSNSSSSIAAFRQSLVPQLVLPPSSSGGGGFSSARNRFPDTDSAAAALRTMASGGGRGSRRVSLPAGSLLPIKAAQSNLSEARGMLADMLAQKDLPPHLVSGLKAVGQLLIPGTSNAAIAGLNFDFTGASRVLESPYIGGEISLASIETAAQRRLSPAVVWSTTTSATGLPTLEQEPSRARSSSYWKHKQGNEAESEESKALSRQSIDLPSKLVQLLDGTIYDLADITRDPYLARLKDWGLPIFEMYADSPDTILSKTAYTVFQRTGLFRIFKIDKRKFLSLFHALEKGYWNIPYHNRVHATDVLQATYYFTCHKVPAFAGNEAIGSSRNSHKLGSIGEEVGSDDDHDEDETYSDSENKDSNSSNNKSSSAAQQSPQLDDLNGTICSVLSSLELMALFTAAAMHDFDHPGRTNAFLVAIQDKKATLYNDRSVLENHHAAAAWQLLTRPENNFVEQLDPAEFKRFRYTIIEAILATDLKRHFEILMDFNGKVAKGLDWDNEVDKLLTCQICIKMADINSPTKPGMLHKEWTDRILEEFYAQGDEEKERGLPVSPYMDRHDAQLARLQDSFIAHLVAPLAMAMNEAGLLPLTVDDSNNAEQQQSGAKMMKSELLVNLEVNHKHWKVELGEDPATSVQAVACSVAVAPSSPTKAGSKDEDEMETIEEGDDENGSPED